MDIGCYQAARDSAVHFQKLARWEDVNVDVTEPGRELQHRTAGLAVMKSTKFEFVINLKTAKTLVLKYSRLCLHAQTRRSNEHDDEAARDQAGGEGLDVVGDVVVLVALPVVGQAVERHGHRVRAVLVGSTPPTIASGGRIYRSDWLTAWDVRNSRVSQLAETPATRCRAAGAWGASASRTCLSGRAQPAAATA